MPTDPRFLTRFVGATWTACEILSAWGLAVGLSLIVILVLLGNLLVLLYDLLLHPNLWAFVLAVLRNWGIAILDTVLCVASWIAGSKLTGTSKPALIIFSVYTALHIIYVSCRLIPTSKFAWIEREAKEKKQGLLDLTGMVAGAFGVVSLAVTFSDVLRHHTEAGAWVAFSLDMASCGWALLCWFMGWG
jgi:hypothetical protein